MEMSDCARNYIALGVLLTFGVAAAFAGLQSWLNHRAHNRKERRELAEWRARNLKNPGEE